MLEFYGLSDNDRQAFDRMLGSFLDEQLADATRLAEGDTSEKLTAFDTASLRATALRRRRMA